MSGSVPFKKLVNWLSSLIPAFTKRAEASTTCRLFSRHKIFNIQKGILSGIGTPSGPTNFSQIGNGQVDGETECLKDTIRIMQQRITNLERALKFQMLLPRKVASLRRHSQSIMERQAPLNSHRMQKEMQLLKQWLYPENQDGSGISDEDYYQQCPPEYYSLELKDWFQRKTRKALNLDHPKTFNEKTQWLKLYDSTNIKTILTDKFLVRDWVKDKIGSQYLTPLIGVYNKAEEIPFDDLPASFVIKATHGSGMNLIVTDKQSLNWEEAKPRINAWLNRNHAFEHGFELHYAAIVPRILVEDYLESGPGAPEDKKKPPYTMDDYKVWCFGGKAHFIQFATGHVMAFYNTNWEKQNFTYGQMRQTPCPRPDCLDELLQRAETLAEGFAFVRVDFYILPDSSLKFGEMTFTSSSGGAKWNPPSTDDFLGTLITLPGLNVPDDAP